MSQWELIPLLPPEGPARLHIGARKSAFSRHQICQHLTLDFTAYKTVGNRPPCLQATLSKAFCYSNANRLSPKAQASPLGFGDLCFSPIKWSDRLHQPGREEKTFPSLVEGAGPHDCSQFWGQITGRVEPQFLSLSSGEALPILQVRAWPLGVHGARTWQGPPPSSSFQSNLWGVG